jgi:hypothetical protein
LAAVTSTCGDWTTEALQMRGNKPKRTCKVPHDKLNIQPQHEKPEALEHRVPPAISGTTLSVIASVDFNDELSGGSNKVNDVSGDDHLPAKRDAELAVDERSPKPSFGSGGSRAHGGSPSGEQ